MLDATSTLLTPGCGPTDPYPTPVPAPARIHAPDRVAIRESWERAAEAHPTPDSPDREHRPGNRERIAGAIRRLAACTARMTAGLERDAAGGAR